MTSDNITRHTQLSDLGAKVELIDLDATALGDTVIRYFTPVDLFEWLNGTAVMTNVLWGGHVYVPIPLKSDGWEWDGKGQPPTPKITLANVNGFFTAANIAFNDLAGAILTRRITFDTFLEDSHTTEAYQPEIYRIERKLAQDNVSVEYELANALDHLGAQIPARLVLRNVCQRTYRTWDSSKSQFDYSEVTCPYTGTDYFKFDDTVTTDPAQDQCSFHLTGCKPRFVGVALPMWAFPGAGQTGQLSP